LEKENRTGSQEVSGRGRRHSRAGGIGRNKIKTKQAHQVAGVARDILRETSAGQYDACAIGKKGTGWFDDVFLGSITNKLLEVSENHPLWLVSGDEWISPKVFIVMDHTPQAVQLATHVGNMLRGLEGVHVSFYHYCSPFTETLPPEEREKMNDVEKRMVEKDRDQMQHFFEEALRVLEDSGFHRQTVGSEFEQGESGSPKKVSQRILQKVRDGNYGTLVIGRKGATGAREFRLGSVAWRIATEAENCAVWVVPAR
jgi:nucleotide-binding universal stress UspA family protein